jgi:hypothetical protein
LEVRVDGFRFWPEGWEAVQKSDGELEELVREELASSRNRRQDAHPLDGEALSLIGRSLKEDKFLFALNDKRVAETAMTPGAKFLSTGVFDDLWDWVLTRSPHLRDQKDATQ